MRFSRVWLLDNAAFIVRPHTASATAKAADHARALTLVAQGWRGDFDRELGRWEAARLAASPRDARSRRGARQALCGYGRREAVPRSNRFEASAVKSCSTNKSELP